VIVTGVALATPDVPIVNVADVAPPATVTEAGTVAFALPELRFTDVPPVGAMPVSVTVPVDDMPPITEVGETVKLRRVAALIVKVDVRDMLACPAVIVAEVVLATPDVVIVKFAEVAPAGTVT
jgi:hypothetical protein